jgi:hypothetical protein
MYLTIYQKKDYNFYISYSPFKYFTNTIISLGTFPTKLLHQAYLHQ